MRGQRPDPRSRVFFTAAVLFLAARTAMAAENIPGWLREMQEDAELTDVDFPDPTHGWAVGDRGTIYATNDGGKHWRLQPARVECRLGSVQFLDADNGWAAGGDFFPYTHTSRGLLLRTRDGGRSWAEDKGLVLPALKKIQFFNAKLGWAFGESSALFPAGVFVTDNGGRTWSPIEGRPANGWLTADFLDAHAGAIAGRDGSLAVIRRRGLAPARTPNFGWRSLNRMKFANDTVGWLVGDGGLVLTTADAGLSWQLPEADPTALVGNDVDWHALEVRGERVWIAGAPGSKVLTSEDGGQHWQAFSTDQNLPLYGVAFADNLHGWAVGAFGTILATADGGRTWQRQRSGGTRAAVLAIYHRASDVPLELLARLSGNDGYLAAVEVLSRRSAAGERFTANTSERSHAALVDSGASEAHTAANFPLPPTGRSAEEVVDAWNRLYDGEGIEQIEAFLVRKIRCWRPEIVVTHAACLNGDDPHGHVVNQLVLQAVEQAADPTCFPEQLSQTGLAAWKVRKVFGSLPDGQIGDVNISTAQLAQRFGTSLADHVAAPRGLMAEDYTGSPANVGFRLYVDTLPQHVGEHDFFSGITLHPGGEARRNIGEFATLGVDVLRRLAQKQRNVQAIITRAEQGQLDAARYAAQINDLTAGLDASTAGNVIYQLGQHYRQTGKWPLAAETFTMLVERHPAHPLSEAALVWLVRYWSSGEAAWQERRLAAANGQRAAAAQVASQITVFQPPAALGQVLPAKNEIVRGNAPHVDGRLNVAEHTLEADRASRAVALGKLLEQRNPSTYAEPHVRFSLASAYRQQGLTKETQKHYLDVIRLRDHDDWWTCAAGERWLQEPKDLAPKNILRASGGPRPRLDGRLDDAIWQRTNSAELKGELSDVKELPAKAMLAYDNEFLYLAVECRRSGARPTANAAPRTHDTDLSAHDRVDFFFDLDRDWSTWYRLTVDDRGWTGEACFEHAGWNPAWFVASGGDDSVWTAEAAIPLAELTAQRPQPRYVWALGIERTIPGAGAQSWTAPTSAPARPEAFGYLIFE